MNSRAPLRILMVEDSENDRLLEEREMKRAGFIFLLSCVQDRTTFLKELESFNADLILCDYSLPQFSAPEALEIVQERAPQIPVIVVTGTLTDETAVDCLKKGALDYVIKENIARLPFAINRALDHRRMNEQKKSDEERLRQSEKLLRVMTGVLPALLAYLAPDLKIQFCNRIYERWFSFSNEQVLGLQASDAFGESIADELAHRLHSLPLGESVKFESHFGDPKEGKIALIVVTPDRDLDGKIKGFVCLMTDITAQKHYEEELMSAKEQADAANEAKSQFLANMSHEMRTPLSAMMGFAELLMMPGQELDDREDWLGRIVKNCERLKKLIDEILDLSKIEAGKLEVYRVSFSIPEVISQVKSILFPLAREKNLELRFEVVGSIPEIIESDPIKLRHIFINIIGNAIKFSERGPITTRVQMTSDEKMSFEIEDFGPGLSPQQSRNLFEPFMQVDSSMTRKAGGTGLGLALARRYARALGGDVELTRSVPGEGSTFTVTIDTGPIPSREQVRSLADDHDKPMPFSFPKYAARVNLPQMKVLVVDDVLDNQILVRHLLEKAGAQVEVASDGQEAVRKALRSEYDLILMDLQMPILDGYHATSQLRHKGYTKPILALTAHALKEEQARCLRMGFNGFLTKPIRQNDLLSKLSAYHH